MTTADALYYIGRSHMVCQDVARAWVDGEGRGHAVVCDGCSTSPNTEMGAALLSQAAAVFPWKGVGVIEEAEVMANACHLDRACLDATLLRVTEGADSVHAELWGDGFVVAKIRGQDEYLMGQVEFRENSPTYPAYLLNQGRMDAYLAKTDCARRDVRWHWRIKGRWGVEERDDEVGFHPLSRTFPKGAFEFVMIASDGLASFRRRTENGALVGVPVFDVLDRVLDFKNFQGEFVKRRMLRFLRSEAPTLGWHHDDDVAVAVVYVEGT